MVSNAEGALRYSRSKIFDFLGNGDVIVSGDLIPALGESWSHACSTSLEINFVKMETRQNKRLILRELNIVKSPLVKSPSKTYFYISEEGICNRNVSK